MHTYYTTFRTNDPKQDFRNALDMFGRVDSSIAGQRGRHYAIAMSLYV